MGIYRSAEQPVSVSTNARIMLTAGSRPPELTEYVVHTVSVRINWMLVQIIQYGMSFKALTDYYFSKSKISDCTFYFQF